MSLRMLGAIGAVCALSLMAGRSAGAAPPTPAEVAQCAQIAARPAPSPLSLEFSLLGAMAALPSSKAFPKEDLDEFTAENELASKVMGEHRIDDALAAQRKALAAAIRIYGPEDVVTYAEQTLIAGELNLLDRYAEAFALLKHPYAGLRWAKGEDASWTEYALHELSLASQGAGQCHALIAIVQTPVNQGMPGVAPHGWSADDVTAWKSQIDDGMSAIQAHNGKKAAAAFKQAVARAEAAGGKQGAFYSLSTMLYGMALAMQGDIALARPLIEGASADTEIYANYEVSARILPLTANLMLATQQYDEVTLLIGSHANEISAKGDDAAVEMLIALATAQWQLDDKANAEKWARRAVEIARSNPSVTLSERYQAEVMLADILGGQRQYAEAERRLRALLADADTRTEAPGIDLESERAHLAERVANMLNADPTPGDPLPYATRALAGFKKQNPLSFLMNDLRILDGETVLAAAYLKNGDFQRAVDQSKDTCGSLEDARNMMFRDLLLKACRFNYAAGLVALARQSPAPEKLNASAFEAAQNWQVSSAGAAVAYASARASGNEQAQRLASAYDDALAKAAALDRAYDSRAANSPDTAALRDLNLRRAAAAAQVSLIADQISRVFPGYWDLRNPEPVSVKALQSRSGPDSNLLHDDEALIYIVIAGPGRRNFIFAGSKTKFASAEISMSGDEIDDAVKALRRQIDPCSYGATPASCGQKPGPFDRAAAYRLYQALLGDPAIRDVIQSPEIKTLLFVPTASLTSLPPGVLVTAPPGGRDDDPAALRATQWLLRSKAIAIVPTVASLRLLRGPGRQSRAGLTTPNSLVAFADPDFAGAARPVLAKSDRALRSGGPLRGLQTYFRMGQPLGDALRGLTRLKGTAQEAGALQRALAAPVSSLHLGMDASETTLRALQASGELARASVVEFATHGLIAGNVNGLAQPALALAAPRPGADAATDDGMLTAAEAASLQINADWVILSACNSAAPDAPAAQGLSGLSRAFFFAGARALLVSHWRVRDDVAALLTPNVLERYRADPALSKAQALRQASLAVLDSGRPEFAVPSAWAAFVLIGDPQR